MLKLSCFLYRQEYMWGHVHTRRPRCLVASHRVESLLTRSMVAVLASRQRESVVNLYQITTTLLNRVIVPRCLWFIISAKALDDCSTLPQVMSVLQCAFACLYHTCEHKICRWKSPLSILRICQPVSLSACQLDSLSACYVLELGSSCALNRGLASLVCEIAQQSPKNGNGSFNGTSSIILPGINHPYHLSYTVYAKACSVTHYTAPYPGIIVHHRT
jgi:hypothetical protein